MVKMELNGLVIGVILMPTGIKEQRASLIMSLEIMKMAYSGWTLTISFNNIVISISVGF
jgi:hypothetical protein